MPTKDTSSPSNKTDKAADPAVQKQSDPANIFEALRASHEVQRSLCEQVTATSGASEAREALFRTLRDELAAHALAEERHFYVPLMQHDTGIDLSRHAIAEHHELDELVEDLETTDMSSPAWLVKAKKLADEVLHHLKEEEQKFFQMAGKLLSEKQKKSLAKDYAQTYQEAKAAS